MLTLERMDALLICDPQAGTFTWRVDLGSNKKAGVSAGWRHRRNGYVYIQIDGKAYFRHRLVWFYVYKEWPTQIDHIDNVPGNDSIYNLRLATRSQNRANSKRPITNMTGFKGINYNKRDNLWGARIGVNKKRIHLGWFSTPEDAHKAYQEAAVRLHGKYARFK
jgi:hypothetical protein